MLFSLSYNNKFYTQDQITTRVYYLARRKVLLYKQRINEKLLDQYIKAHYNSNLIFLCLRIINRATISVNNKNEVIVVIPDKKLDQLASLITYGNSEVPGSNILKDAFSN